MVGTAAYTLDPFIEEIIKVLPLTLLLISPLVRRQLSVTDCALMGSAAGAGFGLAENLYRYGGHLGATAYPGGWLLNTSSFLYETTVPNVWTALHLWVPAGATSSLTPNFDGLNVHLVWSCLGGLAVGLIVQNRRVTARIAGLCLLLYVGLAHAAFNADLASISDPWFGPLAKPLKFLSRWTALMPVVALVTAWGLDRYSQYAHKKTEIRPSVELAASTRLSWILRAAVSRLPWSLLWIFDFIRLRRAYKMVRSAGPSEQLNFMGALVVRAREKIDQARAQKPRRLTLMPSASRRFAIILWILYITPSLVWFFIGGSSQKAMSGTVVWKFVLALSVGSQAWVGWQVFIRIRSWVKTRSLPIADDIAIRGLQVACGLGGISLGGFALFRAFSGLMPQMNLLHDVHAQEALAQGDSATALQLANGAAGLVPPSKPSGEKGLLITNSSELDPAELRRRGFKLERTFGNTQMWVNAKGEEIWLLPPAQVADLGPVAAPGEAPTPATSPAAQIPPDIQEILQYKQDYQGQSDDLYRRSKELQANKDLLDPAEYAQQHSQWTADWNQFDGDMDKTLNEVIPSQAGQLTPEQQRWKDQEVQDLRNIRGIQPGDFWPPSPH